MILPLKKDDFGLMLSSKDYGYEDEWKEEMLKSAIKNDNFYGFKVEIKEEVLGYAHFSVSLDALDINSVFVFPKNRKNGVGETLINEILSFASKKNIEKIFLEVRESNAPAINLYEKLGFKSVAKRNKYYIDGENALVMLKENLL